MYCERGVSATNEACEYFALSEAKQRRCEECHDWYPLDTMPQIGECHNPTSPRCGKAIFWDQLTGACFVERSLERMEFPWCRTCRETVLASDLYMHRGHDLFAGSSHPPVEDMMELTFAGD